MAQLSSFLKNKEYYILLEELFSKSTHTMDDLLDKLKERGFCLQEWDIVKNKLGFKISEKNQNITYAVKRTNFEANNPKADKFDYSLVLGIDYHAKRRTSIPIYLMGDYLGKRNLPWPDSHRNFKEKKATVLFPGYMTIEERKVWRADYSKVINGKKPTEFYLQHIQAIKDLNPNFIFE